MLIPLHERSHAGIFSSIFIDIGDEQSIEDDLSTYSSLDQYENHDEEL